MRMNSQWIGPGFRNVALVLTARSYAFRVTAREFEGIGGSRLPKRQDPVMSAEAEGVRERDADGR
jgi:hypothetical protein